MKGGTVVWNARLRNDLNDRNDARSLLNWQQQRKLPHNCLIHDRNYVFLLFDRRCRGILFSGLCLVSKNISLFIFIICSPVVLMRLLSSLNYFCIFNRISLSVNRPCPWWLSFVTIHRAELLGLRYCLLWLFSVDWISLFSSRNCCFHIFLFLLSAAIGGRARSTMCEYIRKVYICPLSVWCVIY